jgi:hypothetical protein
MLIIILSIAVVILSLLLLITLSVIHTNQQDIHQLRKEISKMDTSVKLQGSDVIRLANHTANITNSLNDLIHFVTSNNYSNKENEKSYFGPEGQS